MIEYGSKSALELSHAIASRELSCVQLMEDSLDHIDSINTKLNCLVALRSKPELMAEAKRADAELAKGSAPEGWLHGIPFAFKDLVNTANTVTTYGSPLFADNVPLDDDRLARQIRAAGAINIGKTNTPEFGLGSQTYNPVYGATRNPYNIQKTAGGSSGGAASALAARLFPVLDGSDMMGSLRNPAAYCNVYGFRPSVGRVVSDPEGDTCMLPLATTGPMARTVCDIAALLDTIAGPLTAVPHSLPAHSSFLQSLEAPLKACKIAWLGNWDTHLPIDPEILSLCETGLRNFETLGCKTESIACPFDADELWYSWTVLRSQTIAAKLLPLYEDADSRVKLKPEAVWEVEQGLSLSGMDVYRASEIRSRWIATVARLFETYDLLVLPSAQLFAFDVDMHWPDTVESKTMKTYHQWMEVVVPGSLAGLPILNVPVGFGSKELPMGMQLMGAHGNDAMVLRLGEVYHQATQWPQRRPPAL